MTITRKDFLKIRTTILVVLVVAASFITATESISIGEEMSYLLIPVIVLFGLMWFIVDVVKYIKSKSYFPNAISIKNIGGLMGLTWLILIEVALIVSLFYLFDGYCNPQFFGGQATACSFFSYLSGKDSGATIVIYVSLLWFVPVPIIMYIIGFFVDRYTSKKNKVSPVAN